MRIIVSVKYKPDVASIADAVRQQGIPVHKVFERFGLFLAEPADQLQLGQVERTPGVDHWNEDRQITLPPHGMPQ